MKTTLSALIAAALLAVTAEPLAAAPQNDNFADRVTITGLMNTVTGSNVDATKEPGEPDHSRFLGGTSVWWTWTATADLRVTIDTTGSSFDAAAVLAVYVGNSVSNLLLVGDGVYNPVSFSARAGTAYQIAVEGLFGSSGYIKLNLVTEPALPRPLNDDFAEAIAISGVSNTIVGSLSGATAEPGEGHLGRFTFEGSVWYQFVALTDGTITIQKPSRSGGPQLIAYQGDSIGSLTLLGVDKVGEGSIASSVCTFTFDVREGRSYHLAVLYRGVSEFTFTMVLAAAPANNAFAARTIIDAQASTAFGTTVGANKETGEPFDGQRTVWWLWTPDRDGPVILTTSGSTFDTALAVYTGASLGDLSLVASNDDCYAFGVTNGPNSDSISRVKFHAAVGTNYSIVVAVAKGEPGIVSLNFLTLAVEEIASVQRILQEDGSVDFTADLLVTNLRTNAAGPLRIRLVARPGYTYRDDVYFRCPVDRPVFDAPDELLDAFDLPGSGTVAAAASVHSIVAGRCSPPYKPPDAWGIAWCAIALLEEWDGGAWAVCDTRLIVNGDWPGVNGFTGGPGGGVVNIVSSIVGKSENPAILSVRLGPPSAVRVGGAWRISPTNFGSLKELRFYTNYTSRSLNLSVRSTNFTIDTKALVGFTQPTNRSIKITPAQVTSLDLFYSVFPPFLTYSSSSGLGITGTPDTAYRIETAQQLLTLGEWSPLTNISLVPGNNSIPNATPGLSGNRFYRAVWRPE